MYLRPTKWEKINIKANKSKKTRIKNTFGISILTAGLRNWSFPRIESQSGWPTSNDKCNK